MGEEICHLLIQPLVIHELFLCVRELAGTLPASARFVNVCVSALTSKCEQCKTEHFMDLCNFSLHVT